MKKQIILTIACIISITNIYAQNPIDEFLRKYDSKDGITNVSMSKQMLESVFDEKSSLSARPSITISSSAEKNMPKSEVVYTSSPALNVPEAYRSVAITEIAKPKDIYVNFCKLLTSLNYEQYMEVNKENSNVLGYYHKKLNDNNNEIVVIRQQNEQFSAIYIKGDINISQLDKYLLKIRMAMIRLGADNRDTNMALSMGISNSISYSFSNPLDSSTIKKMHILSGGKPFIRINNDSTRTLIMQNGILKEINRNIVW